MSDTPAIPTTPTVAPVVLMYSHPDFPVVAITVCPACQAPRCVRRGACPHPHGDVHWRDFNRVVCRYAGHVVTAQGRPALRCLRCHQPRGEVVC